MKRPAVLLALFLAACGQKQENAWLGYGEGDYAFVIGRANDDKLYSFKKGSGMVVGLGEGFTCVSSDLPSILPLTRNVIRPQDGEIVTLWANRVEVRSVKDGNLIDRGDALAYVELKGHCPEEQFDRLLAAFGWPRATLAFHLPQRGVLLDAKLLPYSRQSDGQLHLVLLEEHPLLDQGLRLRVGGHQLRAARQMEEDGVRFAEGESVIDDERHIVRGLHVDQRLDRHVRMVVGDHQRRAKVNRAKDRNNGSSRHAPDVE